MSYGGSQGSDPTQGSSGPGSSQTGPLYPGGPQVVLGRDGKPVLWSQQGQGYLQSVVSQVPSGTSGPPATGQGYLPGTRTTSPYGGEHPVNTRKPQDPSANSREQETSATSGPPANVADYPSFRNPPTHVYDTRIPPPPDRGGSFYSVSSRQITLAGQRLARPGSSAVGTSGTFSGAEDPQYETAKRVTKDGWAKR